MNGPAFNFLGQALQAAQLILLPTASSTLGCVSVQVAREPPLLWLAANAECGPDREWAWRTRRGLPRSELASISNPAARG